MEESPCLNQVQNQSIYDTAGFARCFVGLLSHILKPSDPGGEFQQEQCKREDSGGVARVASIEGC